MNITLRSDAYVARVSFELRIVISRKGRAYRSKFSSVNIVSRISSRTLFLWINEFTNSRVREREKKIEHLWKDSKISIRNFNFVHPWSTNESLVYTLDWIRNSATRLDIARGSITTWNSDSLWKRGIIAIFASFKIIISILIDLSFNRICDNRMWTRKQMMAFIGQVWTRNWILRLTHEYLTVGCMC